MNLLQPLPTCSQLALHLAAKSVDHALARERDQLHVAGLAGLEAHRGAGGDIEPHAARLLAVELQRRIGLEEMVVRADLDRPVAGIGDRQRHRLAAGVEFDFSVLDEEFAGDHGRFPYATRDRTAARAPLTAASNACSSFEFNPRQWPITCSAQAM